MPQPSDDFSFYAFHGLTPVEYFRRAERLRLQGFSPIDIDYFNIPGMKELVCAVLVKHSDKDITAESAFPVIKPFSFTEKGLTDES